MTVHAATPGAIDDERAPPISLDKQGSVDVEAIYFDVDKRDLKPDSDPATDELAKLVKQRRDVA